MNDHTLPVRLYLAGITDLVSVIPPAAQLAPSSKIPATALGKIPGRRLASGLWVGYNWRTQDATIDDVRQWFVDGANVGLRATHYPGVDIDCADPALAQMIEEAVIGRLGAAPVRTGRAPKRLLAYHTAEPFSRMRLWITTLDGTKHLVEILGEGQQYLVHGVHPSGAPYSWSRDPLHQPLCDITKDSASACLDFIAQLIELAGIGTAEREGDGRRSTRTAAGEQGSLLAPSIEALRECVALIPNSDVLFPTRTEYIKIGYAIRASAGLDHDEEGFGVFAEWAARWDGGVNDPDVVRADYRRLTPPYAVGWNFLAQLARPYGYHDVEDAFAGMESDGVMTAAQENERAPIFSDQWLAESITERYSGMLRFLPKKDSWMVYDGTRWLIDGELQGENLILRGLKEIALPLLRQGIEGKEVVRNLKTAERICSAGTASAIGRIVRADRAVAVSVDALDHDAWILNTPAGLVDLTTGKLSASDPDALCTRITTVPPDFSSDAPEWERFLNEATGGDTQLAQYLKRYAGYCLTGSTREEQLLFIFGPGGNGKGVFLGALSGIMGDYATNASMDTFIASSNEKHTTDLAMLMGARLVTASETAAGKRWDDQRIKLLTGRDRVTARFMRQDNFIFQPSFKLLFIGNHQPEIRDIDDAMKRRVQIVPFTVKPKVVDHSLPDKLRAEWPAILAWMIEGCIEWQRDGLNPPAGVRVATQEYFENEDAYGAWVEECIEIAPDAEGITSQVLFRSWQEWANPRNEFVGTMKRFSSAMVARGWERWKEKGTRRMGFAGVRIRHGKEELRLF